MKVALAGVFLAAPVLTVWLFISPGLYTRKKLALPFVFSTSILFLLGGAFAYKIALPMSLRFLINLGSSFQPMVTITEYLDLILTVILGCAIIFQIPVLIFPDDFRHVRTVSSEISGIPSSSSSFWLCSDAHL
jgi:sec-independent protein translocase protein TatC